MARSSASCFRSWYSSTVEPIHSAPSVQTSFFQANRPSRLQSCGGFLVPFGADEARSCFTDSLTISAMRIFSGHVNDCRLLCQTA